MNRAFLIILIPAILVAAGYVVVFHLLGFTPTYSRLILGAIVFAAAALWLWPKKSDKGAKAGE